MTRQMIALTRIGPSSLDVLPLGPLAEAVIDGVDGVTNPRLERLEVSRSIAVVSFGWIGSGQPMIPDDVLGLFGFRRVELDETQQPVIAEEHLDRYGFICDR